ncbi:hypothetical protein HDU98_011591 [Podochytrium sp. JEL0797]|nr:hypothetical protein HDU98_011591 [Podochytrium sp. JEL0797]
MTIVNTHTAALDQALASLQELETATDFVFSTKDKKTSISTKPAPAAQPTNMPITKGATRLSYKTTLTVDEVLNSLLNTASRTKWDPRFEGMQIIEQYNDQRTEVLIHSLQHGQWPVVSGRDFAIALRSVKVSDSKAYLVFTSVIDAKIPEVKGRVRAHIYCVGWVIEKAPDADAWDLTYFSHVDPVGLPSALTKLIANETPACAGTFAAYVEKNGPSAAF